jgi:hypothetical protein
MNLCFRTNFLFSIINACDNNGQNNQIYIEVPKSITYIFVAILTNFRQKRRFFF